MYKNRFIFDIQQKDNLRRFINSDLYCSKAENEKSFFSNNGKTQDILTDVGLYRVFNIEKNLYTDAEIFFSQFYSHFGFDMPIYFMINVNGKNFLACDNKLDIYGKDAYAKYLQILFHKDLDRKTILADSFHKFKLESKIGIPYIKYLKTMANNLRYLNGINDTKIHNFALDTIIHEKNNLFRMKFFHGAVKDKIKMRILDCVMYNNARSPYNYLYKFFSKGDVDMIESCVPLSSMNSAQNVYYMQNNLSKKMQKKYLSETRFGYVGRDKLIYDTKNNEILKKYFDEKERNEFAKQLSQVTSFDIASDVKENIGYEIDRRYQDTIYDNCEFVSNLLKDDELVM